MDWEDFGLAPDLVFCMDFSTLIKPFLSTCFALIEIGELEMLGLWVIGWISFSFLWFLFCSFFFFPFPIGLVAGDGLFLVNV